MKDCYTYDNGAVFSTKIGERRQLVSRKGYRWKNSTGHIIDSVKCLVIDIGNSSLVSEEEPHQLEDIDECTEAPDTLNCPMKYGSCHNLDGSYRCLCTPGNHAIDNSNCMYSK